MYRESGSALRSALLVRCQLTDPTTSTSALSLLVHCEHAGRFFVHLLKWKCAHNKHTRSTEIADFASARAAIQIRSRITFGLVHAITHMTISYWRHQTDITGGKSHPLPSVARNRYRNVAGNLRVNQYTHTHTRRMPSHYR